MHIEPNAEILMILIDFLSTSTHFRLHSFDIVVDVPENVRLVCLIRFVCVG